MMLLVCIGSIHAADDVQSDLGNDYDEEELDEDLDEFNEDFESEDDLDNSDDENLDEDNLDDENLDDEDNLDDDPVSDYSDFDFLKIKITYYLDRYGNYSGHNWTESEEFLNEYKIYLTNTSNYTLNESSEGYQTYLKIFDSITSTFKDYNLSENETSYLKFMIIFYLNHYGNVSANYTWNESESFANFTLPKNFLWGDVTDIALGLATPIHHFAGYSNSFNPIYNLLTNSTDVNQTSGDNPINVTPETSGDYNIFILVILVIILMILVFL